MAKKNKGVRVSGVIENGEPRQVHPFDVARVGERTRLTWDVIREKLRAMLERDYQTLSADDLKKKPWRKKRK